MSKPVQNIVHDDRRDDLAPASDDLEDIQVADSFEDESPAASADGDATEATPSTDVEVDVDDDLPEPTPALAQRPVTREELEDPMALYARDLARAPAMTP